MKIHLIFPPLWNVNLMPMLALPTIAGAIKHFGGNVKTDDFNADFIQYILSNKFLTDIEKQCSFYKKEYENWDGEHDEKFYYLENIIKYVNTELIPQIKNILNDNIIQSYKDSILNGEFIKSDSIMRKIESYIKTISRKYISAYQFEFEYDLFCEYYQNLYQQISEYDADIIAFSLYSKIQINWFNKFIKYFRNKISAKITCGGNQITSTYLKLKDSDSFRNNVDFLMYGNGIQIFKEICNNTPIENINGIVYFKNNESIINPITGTKSNCFYKPDYSTLDLKKYFSPVAILPIESSRGCYHGKCKFCTYPYCQDYYQKDVEDLIEELKYYVNELHVNHFFFTDCAIHPKYAEKMSKRIIEENLKINYITFLRLEKSFTKKQLELMKKAGLTIAMWGLESGSDKILQLYNKKTDTKTNKRILKNSHEVGIYNYNFVMYGFPKETIEDYKMTVDFLIDNFKYCDYISMHILGLSKATILFNEKEHFGLKEEDFPNYTFVEHKTEIKQHKRFKELRNKLEEKYAEKLNCCSDPAMLLIQVSAQQNT